MNRKWGIGALGAWLWAVTLWAGTVYPPVLNPHNHSSYILRLVEQNPWLQSSGIAAHLPTYTQYSQRWLSKFYALEEFEALNKDRPDPITIHLFDVKEERVKVPTFSRAELQEINENIARVVERYPTEEALEEAIRKKIALVSETDGRKLLTGMIRLLPKEKRNKIFLLKSAREQWGALADSVDLTDEALKDNFDVGIHGLRPEQNHRKELLKVADSLLAQEEEILGLIRAWWFQSSEKVDPEETDPELRGTLTEKLKDIFGNRKKDPGRYLRFLRPTDPIERNEVVKRRESKFKIQEVSPELAMYRGVLGGDCATTNSYAFPFSPMERVYYVFDRNDRLYNLYLSGTILEVKGRKTLYLHSIGGPQLTTEFQSNLVHALFAARERIGVEQITIPTLAVRNKNAAQEPAVGTVWRGLIDDLDGYLDHNELKNTYLDTRLRAFLGSLEASVSTYDSPEENPTSYLFEPKTRILNSFEVDVVAGVKASKPEKPAEKLEPKDAFIRLLDLLSGEGQPEMYFEELGIAREEADRIVALVNNSRELPLREYYETLEKEFARFEIGLSEKFMKKHSGFFMLGHLSAPDAVETGDEGLKRKTVEYTIELLKRGRVRDAAFRIVAREPEFFQGDNIFKEYVGYVALRGPGNLDRVEKLIEAGVKGDLLWTSLDRASEGIRSGREKVQLSALRWLRQFAEELPVAALRAISEALDNEEHDSDKSAILAVKYLMKFRTKDAKVNEALENSVLEEENLDIAYRAAIALLRNGVASQEAKEVLEGNDVEFDSDITSLSRVLRRIGERTVKKASCSGLFDQLRPPRGDRPRRQE